MTNSTIPPFAEWVAQANESRTGDPLWSVQAYRLAVNEVECHTADRNHFYGYALGSAREAIAWYDTLRIELGDLASARQSTLVQVRRLLLTTLKRGRSDSALVALSDPTRVPSREAP